MTVQGLDEALNAIRGGVHVACSRIAPSIAHAIMLRARYDHPWRPDPSQWNHRRGEFGLEASIKVHAVRPDPQRPGGWSAQVIATAHNRVGRDFAAYVEFRYDRQDRWSYMAPANRAVWDGEAAAIVNGELNSALAAMVLSRGMLLHATPSPVLLPPAPDPADYRTDRGGA